MSAPHHHPDAELLLDYATGAGSSVYSLVIWTHLRACAECRSAVAAAQSVGGLLLDESPPAKLGEDALSVALARIERPVPALPIKTRAQPRPDWIEVPQGVLTAAQRRRWAAPGVWVAPVSRNASGQGSYLLRVAPGMGVPRHTHRGSEMVCVLKGAFDDRGENYGPGDFACSDETVEHRPVAMHDTECICLIAADHRLVARDWVGRLFQPFVRI